MLHTPELLFLAIATVFIPFQCAITALPLVLDAELPSLAPSVNTTSTTSTTNLSFTFTTTTPSAPDSPPPLLSPTSNFFNPFRPQKSRQLTTSVSVSLNDRRIYLYSVYEIIHRCLPRLYFPEPFHEYTYTMTSDLSPPLRIHFATTATNGMTSSRISTNPIVADDDDDDVRERKQRSGTNGPSMTKYEAWDVLRNVERQIQRYWEIRFQKLGEVEFWVQDFGKGDGVTVGKGRIWQPSLETDTRGVQ